MWDEPALFEQADDATPLSHEEREGLIPSYITLRRELNEAEFTGIAEAESWAFARKRNVLDERFLNNLHKRMFGRIWRWAGQYRRSDKNLRVDWTRVPVELRQLRETAATGSPSPSVCSRWRSGCGGVRNR